MRVLLVGDSILRPEDLQHSPGNSFHFAGIVTSDSEQFAADIAVRCSVELVVAHQSLSNDGNGTQLLKKIKIFNQQIRTVLLIEPLESKLKGEISGIDYVISKDHLKQLAVVLGIMLTGDESGSQETAVSGDTPTITQIQSLEGQKSFPNSLRKQSPLILKTFRVLGNVAFSLLILVMATMAFFMVQSKMAGGVPSVAGYQMYVVLSGSMAPAFNTGSLVFVRGVNPLEVQAQDIITFSGFSSNSMLTTHRVVEIKTDGDLSFVTRGDANNVNDPNPVHPNQLVGKVHGSVPYLGYLMGFAQTRQGLIFLVFIPGVLVICYELYNIYKHTINPQEENAA